jgi:hypothetical protein
MKNKHFLFCLALLAAGMTAVVSCDKTPDDDPGIALNPANCHIIASPGTYSFKTVKGNSSEPVGTVASAEVLWESFGTADTPAKGAVVAEASYVAADGVIRFKTPSELKDGNALIAAKDASGNILWSWHIWVCKGWDPDKTAHAYYNYSGKVMDRNLGATSATPGDVSALGLLYQWGRKDPFLSAGSISENIEAASTLKWPEPVLSTAETGTIAYSVAHPTTFITSWEDSFDWYFTGEYDTDNTRWQEEKTIYDPCPDGWKLPSGPTREHDGLWSGACGMPFIVTSLDLVKCGQNYTKVFGDADPIWYPFAGFRTDMYGNLGAVGENAGLWTSTADWDESDPNAKVMAFGMDISITKQGNLMAFFNHDYFRAYAHSVRCVK